MPAPNAIELTNLQKTYAATGNQGAKTALYGLDLNVPEGAIFGLLGPNGAGKSTTINIMAGLVRKTGGTVRICGFDQDTHPRESRAAIGVMPQELNIDPFFSPRAALEMQAGLYGVPASERWTDEILDLVGLTAQADAYARNLSGGMKRRLLLAKALVHRPKVLVLDEPTAGVDIELRAMLWRNVRALNARGMTVILTTHYLEEAEEMCDEIAIINHGRLIERAPTATLLSRADGKTMVIDTPIPLQSLSLPDGVSVTERAPGKLAISYAPSRISAGQILSIIAATGAEIGEIAIEQPDLEDVFVALTSNR